MGLGYDNSLGSDIGITLIATGFEQKDPFAKEAKQANVEDKDKVVFHLDLPKATPVSIPVTKEIVIENIVEERILTPLVVAFFTF
jgi:cell division protein FtsZ